MRLIGAAERGMQMMAQRAVSRRVFGKLIAQHGSFLSDLAKVLELSKHSTQTHGIGLKKLPSGSVKNRNLFQIDFIQDFRLHRYLLFSAE